MTTGFITILYRKLFCLQCSVSSHVHISSQVAAALLQLPNEDEKSKLAVGITIGVGIDGDMFALSDSSLFS